MYIGVLGIRVITGGWEGRWDILEGILTWYLYRNM